MEQKPVVGVIMGSKSDLDPVMNECVKLLVELEIPHEVRVVSAHRTPEWMAQYAEEAEKRGIEVIIAAAGGAAHLPGMTAGHTVLPVLGVPVPLKTPGFNGLDSLLSIVQMPKGIPVGTLAIGIPGAANAALLAASILGAKHPEIRERYRAWREKNSDSVMKETMISRWPPDSGPT